MSERLDVKKTYKLVVNGAFPRSESGRSYEVRLGRWDVPRQRCPGVAQGPARRGGGRARRPGRSGGALRRTTVARCMYRWAEMAESRARRIGGARCNSPRGSRRARHNEASRAPLTASSGTPAGPTRRPRFSEGRTLSRGRTSISHCPFRVVSIGVVAPQESSLEGFVEAVAAPICVGNSVVVLASERRPTAGSDPRRDDGDFGLSRWCAQRLDRSHE